MPATRSRASAPTPTTPARIAPRSFGSFLEAAEEAAISRLYGGIHLRAAIVNGLAQGRCIGRAALPLRA